MGKKTIPMVIRMDEELKQSLADIAEQEDMSQAAVMRVAIRAHIRVLKKKRKGW